MPLTVSHPAAAWLVRRWIRALPLDALVIGTMSPDFEYILRLRVYGRFGHTPLGLLAFCLPVGLAACWIFRAVVRPAMIRHLPAGMRAAAPPNRWLLSGAAVLAGAATHVLWDGFTHRGADFVVALPALAAGSVPVYTILQHLSTAVGAIAIAMWVRARVLRHPEHDRRYHGDERAAAVRVAAALFDFAAVAALLNGARRMERGLGPALGYAAVGGMAGLAGAAIAYGLWVKGTRRAEPLTVGRGFGVRDDR